MGSCSCCFREEEFHAHWVHNAAQFKAMGLGETQIKILFKTFKLVERRKVNANGEVLTMDIISELIGEVASSNRFWLKCFRVFDIGKREPGHELDEARLNFRQFIYTVWNLCSLSHQNLVHFAVQVYNVENLAVIPIKLLRTIITEVYGEIKMTKNPDAEDAKYIVMDSVRNQLETYNDNKPYRVADFVAFCHAHRAAFFPAYDALEAIHKKLFGAAYWTERTHWREQQPVRFRCVKDLQYMCEHHGNLPKLTAQLCSVRSNSPNLDLNPTGITKTAAEPPINSKKHRHSPSQVVPINESIANHQKEPKPNELQVVHPHIGINFIPKGVEVHRKTWTSEVVVNIPHHDGQFDDHRPHSHNQQHHQNIHDQSLKGSSYGSKKQKYTLPEITSRSRRGSQTPANHDLNMEIVAPAARRASITGPITISLFDGRRQSAISRVSSA